MQLVHKVIAQGVVIFGCHGDMMRRMGLPRKLPIGSRLLLS